MTLHMFRLDQPPKLAKSRGTRENVGTVVRINSAAFGFISPDSDTDNWLFFHKSQVEPPLIFGPGLMGKRVEFKPISHNGRRRAVNIRLAKDDG